jgi:ATP-dependent 26S proteasome regulatory subunit
MVEQLPNTVLLHGPSGVGKTAAVYACAKQIGLSVLGTTDRTSI